MIGVIGGSGFYEFLENPEKELVKTPFGNATVFTGKIENKNIVFIPRHGNKHSILPSQINYRANIYSAIVLKAKKIYATNAVGTSNLNVKPGNLVVLDQIIDVTNNRISTFFDDPNIEIVLNDGSTKKGVVHTDVSQPFDNIIRDELITACKKLDENVNTKGTIAVFNGPRYETPAEVKAYTILGAEYFGMTSSPEAFLAKELKIPYATLAVATNFAAGLQSGVTHDEVTEIFNDRINVVKNVIRSAIINTWLTIF